MPRRREGKSGDFDGILRLRARPEIRIDISRAAGGSLRGRRARGKVASHGIERTAMARRRMPTCMAQRGRDRGPGLGPATRPSPLPAHREPFIDESDRVLLCQTTAELAPFLARGEEPPSFEPAGARREIFFDPQELTCGIVTCGGLCPGLNNVVRAIVLSLTYAYGVGRILGFRYGYEGLAANGRHEPIELTPQVVDTTHEQGGTFLGSSRGPQDVGGMVDTLERHGVGILFVLGGDGGLRGASVIHDEIARRGRKIAVVGVPKTIDNDLQWMWRSFGFSTAVDAARTVIQAAHTEARAAWNGVGLVKLMGRHSGFIAAHATLANNDVNFCLVPEVPLQLEGEDGFLPDLERRLAQKHHAVVVVAEGSGQDLARGDRPIQHDKSGNVKLHDVGHLPARRDQALLRRARAGGRDPLHRPELRHPQHAGEPDGRAVLLDAGPARRARGDGRATPTSWSRRGATASSRCRSRSRSAAAGRSTRAERSGSACWNRRGNRRAGARPLAPSGKARRGPTPGLADARPRGARADGRLARRAKARRGGRAAQAATRLARFLCSSHMPSGVCEPNLSKYSFWPSSASFHSLGLTSSSVSSLSPGRSTPFRSSAAGVGTQPIAVFFASPRPSQRSSTHFRTRRLSPKPGQMNLPFSSVRNQLTRKMRGGLRELLADVEPVPEVVAHVVAAERLHGHGVAAQDADLAGRRGRGLGRQGRAEERAVLPGLAPRRRAAPASGGARRTGSR